MLSCNSTTRMFTDNRNLLFAFNPFSMEPSLGRHSFLKVVRWALFLSSFTYRIEPVYGDANTWPDIMTRWMCGYRKNPAVRCFAPALQFSGVPVPPDSPEFEWPALAEIRKAQEENLRSAPESALPDDGGTLRLIGAAWIPDDGIDLKLRLLTIAHAWNAGHHGADPTRNSLREHFC